jgi:elongation factor G
VIKEPGRVDKGTTVCDYDAVEKEFQHSLDIGITSFNSQGTHVNLIDTPGFPDFLGRSISILPAVETGAVVINALSGVESITQRMMEVLATRQLCRLILVNQIDQGVNLANLTKDIQRAFGNECLPINLPANGGRKVVDCYFQSSGEATDFSSVSEAHGKIIDQVVEVDEALMELYLEQGEELEPEQLHGPFEKALREGHLVPICFISAQTGVGVPELIEVFRRLMPNPTEGNPPPFMKGEGVDLKPVQVTAKANLHVLAHAFKVINDPFRGKLGIFRIHQGTVTADTQLYVGDARKPFKVNRLFRLHGAEQIEVPKGVPGDICAVARVDDIHFDAVLHDSHDEDHHHLKSMECPVPLFGLAIHPSKRGDEQKLHDALHKLMDEDPCLHLEHNVHANETVIRGLGDQHLKVMLRRLSEQYRVEVDTHPPSIAYLETITASAEGHHRHKKQTGGAGQFGEVFLRIAPLERGAGFVFKDVTVGASIPGQFLPAVEKGVRIVLDEGAVAGYPLKDVQVEVYDGKHHPVDSKEIAFITAGKRAFLDAVAKAKPVILEPIVKIQILAPNTNMGDLTGDLSTKRGRISGSEALSNNRVAINGVVPLAELDGYDARLKSITGGEGSYSIEFSHYEAVPASIQKQLAEGFQHSAD